MGTSGAQRSPHTPEWAWVNALYRDPSATPPAIASAIVAALDAPTRQAMAGTPVAACLGALLQATGETAEAGLSALLARYGSLAGPPALALAAAARSAARAAILGARQNSIYGHLALDAAGTTALEAALAAPPGAGATADPFSAEAAAVQAAFGRYARARDLSGLSGLFFGHDLGRTFEHFVARDVPQHVGTPGVPDARAAALLADRVGAHAREITRRLALGGVEDELQRAVRLGGERRARELQGLAAEAVGEGLRLLERGEAAP